MPDEFVEPIRSAYVAFVSALGGFQLLIRHDGSFKEHKEHIGNLLGILESPGSGVRGVSVLH